MNVEDALTEAGAAWRSRQPAPPEPDPARFEAVRPRWRTWVPIAALVGVAAVIAAVAVPLLAVRPDRPAPPVAAPASSSSTPSSSTPDPRIPADWALPADPGNGVLVVGKGTLLRDGPGKPIRLCAEVMATLDMPSSGAACGPISVATTGADPALLIRTTTKGQAYSEPVRVEGLYHNGTLAVTAQAVAPASPMAPYTEPSVPCPTPAGGWPLGEGTDDVEALRRLTEFVRSHPERFTDLWQGHPDGPPKLDSSGTPTRSVYVIGTTGDLAKADADLRAIYPGNLCVHAVARAGLDLEGIAESLQSTNSTPIEAYADPILGGVRVTVVALDPVTLGLLRSVAGDALIVEEPLLTRLT